MLDKDFCEILERHLTKTFANSTESALKRFWCDGVLLPTFETEYSKKFVNDNKKIVMIAFIGPTGQDNYQLTLNFGNKALSKYARDLEISECLPSSENSGWFDIDVERQKIVIQLD